MKTTEDLVVGGYKTVIEAFIPDEVVNSQNAAVGFAFKTCDQDYTNVNEISEPKMLFNDDPWWYFSERFPTNLDTRFILE